MRITVVRCREEVVGSPPPSTNRTASAGLCLRSGIKSASDEVKADFDARKVDVHPSEKVTVIADGLTLDDFGGRSDALGG
jgi:hypothetical protein